MLISLAAWIKTHLREVIEVVSRKLTEQGHATFCFNRDIQEWGKIEIPREQIMPLALENIEKCDSILAILEANSKSTGMGIELGYAKALGKKAYVIKNTKSKNDYIESLADIIDTFDSIKDLPGKLESIFGGKSS